MRQSYNDNAKCGMQKLSFLQFCIQQSAFSISFSSMSVQAITWAPSGAVRIVDQRALPDSLVHRELETIDDVANAIRTLRLRGARLLGIAAAIGLVAGLREARRGGRDALLAQVTKGAACLPGPRPAHVKLRWGLA